MSDHICGNCRWENKGREDCPNNKTQNVRLEQWKAALEERRQNGGVRDGL